MLKLKDNPPTQSPPDVPIGQFRGRWWVAHTRSRQEKALAWDILRSGGSYFLPMYEVTRRRRGRQWRSLLPLFGGYVFVCGGEEDRIRALETDRIARMIEVTDQGRLVGELCGIQRLLTSGLAIDPYPGLVKGSACRIRKGPLAGLEGRLERREHRARFVVSVTILGQGAMVELDADMLEPGA